jgi:hypothetical protein
VLDLAQAVLMNQTYDCPVADWDFVVVDSVADSAQVAGWGFESVADFVVVDFAQVDFDSADVGLCVLHVYGRLQ